MSSSLLPAPPPLRPLIEPVVLRSVAADAAPFRGDVVVHEGEPALAVPVAAVEGTGIWAASGEHVMAPLEVVTTAEGPLVLLPAVRCTLESLLRRRVTVEPGEAVTIAVSLLRGVAAETSAHPRGSCIGTWWLDTAGTPLFVHAHDGSTAAAGAAELIAALDPGDHELAVRAIGAAAGAARDTARIVRGLPALEDDLFAAARPQAVRIDGASIGASITRAQARAEANRPTSALRRLTVAMDGSLSDLVAERMDALRQRWRRPTPAKKPRSRRPVLLVGIGVLGLVLALGLLWPEPGDASPETAPSGVSLPTDDGGVVVPPVDTHAVAPVTDDPVAAATALLAAWNACGDDACRQKLQEARIDADPAGAAGVANVSLTVIDDLGDLTLLRADDPSGRAVSQIVAIVRQNDEWVLRGIHDVAQHP
ncbi:hypothetical protein [Microbacterium sp. SORGH_AS_0862]|uniref:hypothetical protein n=1 Tax=Microbacterium sp. SORGH_AS_0862 TaxID=3041789 RepID=UPI00278D12F9|nr:hypothetical protein [Microbacterium sp. SORGH_AS_0862]MDQ1207060.1 hypothetical protein [Microbacterium sp. SORGH_AS_0862]